MGASLSSPASNQSLSSAVSSKSPDTSSSSSSSVSNNLFSVGSPLAMATVSGDVRLRNSHRSSHTAIGRSDSTRMRPLSGFSFRSKNSLTGSNEHESSGRRHFFLNGWNFTKAAVSNAFPGLSLSNTSLNHGSSFFGSHREKPRRKSGNIYENLDAKNKASTGENNNNISILDLNRLMDNWDLESRSNNTTNRISGSRSSYHLALLRQMSGGQADYSLDSSQMHQPDNNHNVRQGQNQWEPVGTSLGKGNNGARSALSFLSVRRGSKLRSQLPNDSFLGRSLDSNSSTNEQISRKNRTCKQLKQQDSLNNNFNSDNCMIDEESPINVCRKRLPLGTLQNGRTIQMEIKKPQLHRQPAICRQSLKLESSEPIESQTQNIAHSTRKKTVIQASTSELLRALGYFLCFRCPVKHFEPAHLVVWLRTVDRALILQGWQDVAFINPANLVFVYMLIRNQLALSSDKSNVNIRSVDDLHTFVLTSLYIAYSYMGNEISYPLKTFVSETTNRAEFWNRCVKIVEYNSEAMLHLNASSTYFLEVFAELKNYSDGGC